MSKLVTAEQVQKVVEGYLSRKWKAGVIDRSDEQHMRLLRNTSGFSRLYANMINEQPYGRGNKHSLFNEILGDLGYGPMYHPPASSYTKHGQMVIKMARELSTKLWNLSKDARKNPAKLERCVKAVKKRGGAANPWAVCTAMLQRTGQMKRKNPVKLFDSDAATELSLFAENDEPLYRQMVRPIEKNLARKMLAGKYNSALAVKAWRHFVDAAAKKYVKEFGGPAFGVAERNVVAIDFRDAFESEVAAGGLNGLKRYLK